MEATWMSVVTAILPQTTLHAGWHNHVMFSVKGMANRRTFVTAFHFHHTRLCAPTYAERISTLER